MLQNVFPVWEPQNVHRGDDDDCDERSGDKSDDESDPGFDLDGDDDVCQNFFCPSHVPCLAHLV